MRVVENAWIVLADGTRLAARIWMPEGEGPFPAVLEYLPYRKRDGTATRDEATYPAFAAAGYVGVRVDIRGSGESDGVIDGEYTPRELADAVEVIAWIAGEPWCTGAVGMMGISWGGFNALQVAALHPPALKAVISIASTVDRYADDIHYKGGCHLSAQLSWAATMLAYQSRPPDPALVGERWREMWIERLAGEPFFMEEWLDHQRRDAFWRHGSICEDFASFPVPALVIAGWADGYRNTPLKAVAGLGPKAKALIGPWIHKYPHIADPGPRIDFTGEAIAWWDRWLKERANGADAWPEVRAYILDGPRPALRRLADRGRWVALDAWATPEPWRLSVGAGRTLVDARPDGLDESVTLRSPLDCGTMAGEFFALNPDAAMAGDQRADDGGSLVFETHPLTAPVDILGFPKLRLRLTPLAWTGNLAARIVDVHPDGIATRVSLGVLNLTHRAGSEAPAPLVPGEEIEVAIDLDACGYRFGAGHRVRLALSTSYWPTILPPLHDAGVTIRTGTIALDLPLLPSAAREIAVPREARAYGRPVGLQPVERDIHATMADAAAYGRATRLAGTFERTVQRDLHNGTTTYRVHAAPSAVADPATGLTTREACEEAWTIALNDPLSAVGVADWTIEISRGGWSIRTTAHARLSATMGSWVLAARVVAYEGGAEVHRKAWETTIARDLM